MTFLTTKNPSQWINPSGQGYLTNVGNLRLLVNGVLLPILTNGTLLPLLTTPIQSTPKNLSSWSGTGV